LLLIKVDEVIHLIVQWCKKGCVLAQPFLKVGFGSTFFKGWLVGFAILFSKVSI